MSGIKYPDNRLRQLREARGLSLRALSERTGVDFATISFCEKGKRNFSAGCIKALTTFFGVSVDYLLGKSAEQMFDDFVDSIRMDFVGESMDGAGDVVQRLSDSIAEPMRSKLEILFLLREVNSPESLSMILELAKLRRATEDFSGED